MISKIRAALERIPARLFSPCRNAGFLDGHRQPSGGSRFLCDDARLGSKSGEIGVAMSFVFKSQQVKSLAIEGFCRYTRDN